MLYYSTNLQVPPVTLREAVITGLAADHGLFMPGRIGRLDDAFFSQLGQLSFPEIAFRVAQLFFGEDIPEEELRTITAETLSFDCPVVRVTEHIWSLELFHGPTLAFKDVGARFMARMLRYFLRGSHKPVTVLVATSGDTGSAVANGFLGVEGIHVVVLYPSGKVSDIQEKQFTTLGRNITALEINGTFDDCQRLVKTAFRDEHLREKLTLTSANSINVARFLPQAFYYFNAVARLQEAGALQGRELVIAVPSGNFGNLTAGLFAREAGLPVGRFIAANNRNDVVFQYLLSGHYAPRPSVETIANAMDVGTPSNFARILDLYGHDWKKISTLMSGFRIDDKEIKETIRRVFDQTGYLCDPHGACGYAALEAQLKEGETGLFLETAHPAKFTPT
ncbi:MAG TPA: threonine synthase, partial [Prolixibacteraceae bacterium]|nr:threonine synthase [Prolixibacteraceae bacterium]